ILIVILFVGFQIKRMLSGADIIKDVLSISQQFSKIRSIDVSKEIESNTDSNTNSNTDSDKEINNEKTEKIKTEVENLLKTIDGHYGVYYYNLSTKESFGINQDEEFTAASTIKVPINLYLYQRIKDGYVNPQGVLSYTQDDYEAGTGIIQNESFGKKYTVQQLSKLSITYSDNIATNMLLRFIGLKNVKDYMKQLGGNIIDYDNNVTSPRDLGIYMKSVYEFSNKNGELGAELMDNFLNTKFNDRIPELLPKDIRVAHKIGTQVNVINDVGIVYTDKPYILAIMSKDVDEDEAPDDLARLSKKIFDLL
ncbi:MAG: serine hydrolase, partial [Bacillota bacterium]|nr:serine hydrolase [Bacillota bacterium]